MSDEIRYLCVAVFRMDVDCQGVQWGLCLTTEIAHFLLKRGQLGVLIVIDHWQTISLVRT